jgi:hypothetical protein
MLSIFTKGVFAHGLKSTPLLGTGLNAIREASTKTNKTAKLKGQLKVSLLTIAWNEVTLSLTWFYRLTHDRQSKRNDGLGCQRTKIDGRLDRFNKIISIDMKMGIGCYLIKTSECTFSVYHGHFTVWHHDEV